MRRSTSGTKSTIKLRDLTMELEDEDYQDLLFSRDTHVGLRLAPEDTDKPLPVTMDFEFLDNQDYVFMRTGTVSTP